ncbi:hypothetical protein PR048_025259 [Dryococelus australis]|uniref:Uncharacterized protein n=1 Tax=Dryococelus australis TaxID=614101 RepID=A0ABQ9GQX2_9NEOP|nr:hypothetical protein PR048_025259 [Dryococelus australis]
MMSVPGRPHLLSDAPVVMSDVVRDAESTYPALLAARIWCWLIQNRRLPSCSDFPWMVRSNSRGVLTACRTMKRSSLLVVRHVRLEPSRRCVCTLSFPLCQTPTHSVGRTVQVARNAPKHPPHFSESDDAVPHPSGQRLVEGTVRGMLRSSDGFVASVWAPVIDELTLCRSYFVKKVSGILEGLVVGYDRWKGLSLHCLICTQSCTTNLTDEVIDVMGRGPWSRAQWSSMAPALREVGDSVRPDCSLVAQVKSSYVRQVVEGLGGSGRLAEVCRHVRAGVVASQLWQRHRAVTLTLDLFRNLLSFSKSSTSDCGNLKLKRSNQQPKKSKVGLLKAGDDSISSTWASWRTNTRSCWRTKDELQVCLTLRKSNTCGLPCRFSFVSRGSTVSAVRSLASHHDDLGLIPGRVTGFSHVRIVPDAAPYPPQSPSSALKTSLEWEQMRVFTSGHWFEQFRAVARNSNLRKIEEAGQWWVTMFYRLLTIRNYISPSVTKFTGHMPNMAPAKLYADALPTGLLQSSKAAEYSRRQAISFPLRSLLSQRELYSNQSRHDAAGTARDSATYRQNDGPYTMSMGSGRCRDTGIGPYRYAYYAHPLTSAWLASVTPLPRETAMVAELLVRSPPTKANRVQSPAGSPDFRKWESCRTMSLVSGFSLGSPVSPAPSFRRRSIFTSITLIGSQDLALDDALARKQDVLWLDVAVNAVVVVTVGDALQRLPHDLLGEQLRTSLWVLLQLRQHSVVAELEHEVQLALPPEHLQQVHQVRVLQPLRQPHYMCPHSASHGGHRLSTVHYEQPIQSIRGWPISGWLTYLPVGSPAIKEHMSYNAVADPYTTSQNFGQPIRGIVRPHKINLNAT